MLFICKSCFKISIIWKSISFVCGDENHFNFYIENLKAFIFVFVCMFRILFIIKLCSQTDACTWENMMCEEKHDNIMFFATSKQIKKILTAAENT